jgi:hypothetical protein
VNLVNLLSRVCNVWPNAQFCCHELKVCDLLRRKLLLQLSHVRLDEFSVIALEVRNRCGKEAANVLDILDIFLTEIFRLVEIDVGKMMMESRQRISLSLRRISCKTQKFPEMIVRETLE